MNHLAFIREMKKSFPFLKYEYLNNVENGVWTAMDDDDRGVPDYEIDFNTGSVVVITPYGKYNDKFSPSMKTDQNEAMQEDTLKSIETIKGILNRYQIPTRMR